MEKTKVVTKEQQKKIDKFKARQKRIAASARCLTAKARVENEKKRIIKEQTDRAKRHQEILQSTSLKARYAAIDAKFGNVPKDVQNMIDDMTEKVTPEQKEEVQKMAEDTFAEHR